MSAKRSRWFTGFGTQCCAGACTNYTGTHPELLFTGFPKDLDRARRWIINLRRKDFDHLLKIKTIDEIWPHIKHKKICSDHFEKTYSNFKNPANVKAGLFLSKCVPTILAPSISNQPQSSGTKRSAPLRKLTQPSSTITKPVDNKENCAVAGYTNDHGYAASESKTKDETVKKTIRKLKSEIKNLRRSSKKPVNPPSAKEALKSLRECLPPETYRFLESQVRVVKAAPQGRRWTDDDKQVALSLFHSSAATYRLLRQLFTLPSVSTLKQMERQMSITPGFHESVLKALSAKSSSFTTAEKDVLLVVDEITIKESLTYDPSLDCVEGFEDFGCGVRTQYVANHACVFMIRGLQSPWKQPIGYFLTSGTMEHTVLTSKVKEAIGHVFDAGLKVRVLVCDQGSNNQSMLSALGVTISTPYFDFNGHKIISLCDPPHLMKNIRNNLKKSGFKVGEKDVSWSHITQAYNIDSQSGKFRMLHKISEKHIDIPPFKTMSVRLATQILSHTMSSTIGTLVHLGYMPKESLATADFIHQFDTLFDICNSKTFDSKLFRTPIPLTGNVKATEHLKELSALDAWLSTVVSKSKGRLACLDGWRITIAGIRELANDLSREDGWRFLMTRRLNQDCLENFFSIIRGKNGFMDNPDPRQFRAAYRACVMDRLRNIRDGSNCEDDGDSLLVTMQEYSDSNNNEVQDDVMEVDDDSIELGLMEVEVESEEAPSNSFAPVDNLPCLVPADALAHEMAEFHPPQHADDIPPGSTVGSQPVGDFGQMLSYVTDQELYAVPSTSTSTVDIQQEDDVTYMVVTEQEMSESVPPPSDNEAQHTPIVASPPNPPIDISLLIRRGLSRLNFAADNTAPDTVLLTSVEKNVLTYICGYLTRKTQTAYPCDRCLNQQIMSRDSASGTNYVFINEKQYQTLSANQGLWAPSEKMISFTEQLESVMSAQLPILIHGHNIVQKVHSQMSSVKPSVFCSSCTFSFDYLTKLYIRVRIYSVLKRHNQDKQVSKGGKRNRKMLKLLHA